MSPWSSSLRFSCSTFPMFLAVLLMLFEHVLSTSTPPSPTPDKICSRFEMTSSEKGLPYGPTEPHVYKDRLPVDLAKLVFEDANHPQLTRDILHIDYVQEFMPVIHLLQKGNNTMYVVQVGKHNVTRNETHLELGEIKQFPLYYTDVKRSVDSMEFINVPVEDKRWIMADRMAPEDIRSFVYNENLFINNLLVKEADGLIKLVNDSHPCPETTDPIVEIDLYKRPLCHKRKVLDSDEVPVASYRGILSTTKRCSTEFTLTHSAAVLIPGLNVTLVNADLDCHYLRWPDNHTCLYAFGPADLFQGVQLAPSVRPKSASVLGTSTFD